MLPTSQPAGQVAQVLLQHTGGVREAHQCIDGNRQEGAQPARQMCCRHAQMYACCLRSVQVGAVGAGRALQADGGVSGSAVVASLAQVALRHACGMQDEQDALMISFATERKNKERKLTPSGVDWEAGGARWPRARPPPLPGCTTDSVHAVASQPDRHGGARPGHQSLTGAGSHIAIGARLARGGISGDSRAVGSQPIGIFALLAGRDISRADLGTGVQYSGGLVAWQGSGRAGGQGGQANRHGQPRLLQVSAPWHVQTQHPISTYPGRCCGRCCSRGRRHRSGRRRRGTGCSPWRRRRPQSG